jgi:hypothetical protein
MEGQGKYSICIKVDVRYIVVVFQKNPAEHSHALVLPNFPLQHHDVIFVLFERNKERNNFEIGELERCFADERERKNERPIMPFMMP